MELLHHLDKETTVAILLQGWAAFCDVENNTSVGDQVKAYDLKREITELLYSYLEQFTMVNDVLPICMKILTAKDLGHFKDVNQYNYTKLSLILKAKNHE